MEMRFLPALPCWWKGMPQNEFEIVAKCVKPLLALKTRKSFHSCCTRSCHSSSRQEQSSADPASYDTRHDRKIETTFIWGILSMIGCITRRSSEHDRKQTVQTRDTQLEPKRSCTDQEKAIISSTKQFRRSSKAFLKPSTSSWRSTVGRCTILNQD